jgi:prevent-host-death family protein
MQFIAARDFRIRPGSVWKRLRDSGEVVVTSKGKPIALLRDVEGRDLEEEIRTGVMARGLAALRRIRESARQTGVNAMTDQQIETLVAETRKTYRSE